MMVTAQNRMGVGRMKNLSYAGRMIQTSRFRLHDREWLEHNLNTAQAFVGQLGPPDRDASGVPIWHDIPWETVHEFLSQYRTVQDRTSFDAGAAASYIERQVENGELVRWKVAIAAQRSEVRRLGQIDLYVEDWGPVNAIARTRLKKDKSSVGVLTNPANKSGATRQGDEEIGLTDEAIMAARQEESEGRHESIRDALLAQRPTEEGLLVLYPISRYSKPQSGAEKRLDLFDDPDRQGESVIGVALAFPPSDSAATIEYVVGSVGQDDDE
jgi:hypothetical protein